MANRIEIRRGTAAAWTAANPTLLAGEIGWENDTGLFKFGDGATAWATLGYWISTLNLKEVAYTPSFTNFGVCTAINFTWVRSGNHIKVMGKFTAGVVVAGEARLSLPGALVSDAALIPSIEGCGNLVGDQPFSGACYCLIEPGVGYITFGISDASPRAPLTKVNGNVLTINGGICAVQFELPISGWNGP